MQAIHIRNLELYNPGYSDRSLIWCKIYFTMLNSNYEFDQIDDVDKWRFIALVMLELQIKKPIPYDEKWLQSKISNHKRPISLSIKMLHNFIELVTIDSKPCTIEKSRVDKSRVDKEKHLDFVFIYKEEHQKLIATYGEKATNDFIQRLNDYLGSTGKKYKSHYHTILNWIRRDPPKNKPQPDYTAPKEKAHTFTPPKDEMDKLLSKISTKIPTTRKT